jgi:hypothetical protein
VNTINQILMDTFHNTCKISKFNDVKLETWKTLSVQFHCFTSFRSNVINTGKMLLSRMCCTPGVYARISPKNFFILKLVLPNIVNSAIRKNLECR